MNNITNNIEDAIKAIVNSLKNIKNESEDLFKIYFDTGCDSLVGGLATDADPATVTSKLNKGEFVNGITLCESLSNFFGNAAVSTNDYWGTAHNLTNGSDPIGTALSNDVENIGDRLRAMGADLIELFNQSKNVLSLYLAHDVGTAFGGLDDANVVFGANMTIAELSLGITLIEQFKKLMNNEAVTTGDYASTLMIWSRV